MANAVTVKLPTFWTSNAAAWFAQTEAQFGLRQVTRDDTKYWLLVAALDADVATRAAHILANPPEDDTKYQALKAFLISAYELSTEERAEQLLSLTDLGDRRPSEVMDAMLRLSGGHTCFLFRHIFLRLLPFAARQALATTVIGDMRELAREADKVVRASSHPHRPAPCVALAEQTTPTQTSDLQPQEVYPVVRDTPRRSTASGLCYYHRRFGAAAQKCRPPCSWRPGNAQAGPRA